MMTKTQRVMRLDERDDRADDYTLFVQVDPDLDSSYLMDMQILYRDWLELGSPETITVTIEPGDKLND